MEAPASSTESEDGSVSGIDGLKCVDDVIGIEKGVADGALMRAALLGLPREPVKPFILRSGARLGLFYVKAGLTYTPRLHLKRIPGDVGNIKLKQKLYQIVVEDMLEPAKVRRAVCRMAGCRPRVGDSASSGADDDGNGDDGEYDGVSEVYHVSCREMDGRIRTLAMSTYNSVCDTRIDNLSEEDAAQKSIDISDVIPLRRSVLDALVGNVLMSSTYLSHNVSVGEGVPRLIDGMEIDRPIIVLGMPRSGTTFLFNMLNVDDRLRATRNFEGSWCVSVCPYNTTIRIIR